MVERFQAIGTDEDPRMVPTTKGPWVRHAAYASLEAELKAAREASARLEIAFTLSDADRRLWFISDCLGKRGYFNRSDICEAFKISVPQASVDIRRWMEKHPGVVVYNKSAKRYEHVLGVSAALSQPPVGERGK